VTWQAADEPDLDDFLPVVPHLVVDILSPSSIARDRGEKQGIYASSRVAEYWIVDMPARRLEIHVLSGADFAAPLVIERGPIRSRVLPGIDALVEDLFS
jgi:Uma2 family endonuclease